jgi:hypothetical protein
VFLLLICISYDAIFGFEKRIYWGMLFLIYFALILCDCENTIIPAEKYLLIKYILSKVLKMNNNTERGLSVF